MRNTGTGLIKLIIIVAILLTVIQKVTGTTAFTTAFLGMVQSLISLAMPVVIVIGGLYLLMRCLFR